MSLITTRVISLSGLSSWITLFPFLFTFLLCGNKYWENVYLHICQSGEFNRQGAFLIITAEWAKRNIFTNLSQSFQKLLCQGVGVQAELPEHSGVAAWPTEQTAIMQRSPNDVSRDLGWKVPSCHPASQKAARQARRTSPRLKVNGQIPQWNKEKGASLSNKSCQWVLLLHFCEHGSSSWPLMLC